MLYEHLADSIGHTPLVKLSRLGADLDCHLWAKCEFMNPGGSIKDRIAKGMIEDAQSRCVIQPGDTLIEATSGNTGIGLAVVGAAKGYKVILVMPEKMSLEKQRIAEHLGAQIVRTPTEASFDSPNSHLNVAKRMAESLDRAHILDQYNNPINPLTHQHTTAQEILHDLKGDVHMIITGVGTGGTATGLAQAMNGTSCQVVGVDPYGSILAPGSTEVCPYEVEGIGYDFIPQVLKRQTISDWMKVTDKSSFYHAKLLAETEGILCGGSSGSVVSAALKKAKELKKGQNCVLILADGVRNYISKFIDPEWLRHKQLI